MSDGSGTHSDPILVVDDEADLVATYERMLRRKGYRVISAGTRSAGLALVCREPLALLVTDIRLPDGDGLDLVRAVRRLPTPIPAIVATGLGSQASRTAAFAAGAAEYLAKPFAMSTFATLVQNALTTRAREQP
jgi:DNA-binding NtrC family response regulator